MNKTQKPPQSQNPQKWIMCTEEEAKEREACNEISEFESKIWKQRLINNRTNNQRNRNSNNGKMKKYRHGDAYLCIKKYRRSAAGTKKSHVRSIQHLKVTVNHLLNQIFCRQKSYEGMKEATLISCCNFINDRLRAVQVELVHHFETEPKPISSLQKAL